MCYKEAKQETTSIYKQGKMDILSKSIYVFVIALIFGIGIKGTMPQFGIKEGIPKNPSKYPRYLLIYFTHTQIDLNFIEQAGVKDLPDKYRRLNCLTIAQR